MATNIMAKYGHTPIYGHNTSGPNFLTVYDNTINCGYLPIFLWSRNRKILLQNFLVQQFEL